jgi:hypothetical protein
VASHRGAPPPAGYTPPPLVLSTVELLYLEGFFEDIQALNEAFGGEMPDIQEGITMKVKAALGRG